MVALAFLMLVPAYAAAQSTDKIVIQDNFGEFDRGDLVFLFGSITQVEAESFLILQIINPDGDICNIQQLTPLSNGIFLTEQIPLQGSICGLEGRYDVRVFYGDSSASAEFTTTSEIYQKPSPGNYLDIAADLTSQKIASLEKNVGTTLTEYTYRLGNATAGGSLEKVEGVYTDLWLDFVADDEIHEIDPGIRPAVISALDTTTGLLEEDKFSFDIANDIDRDIFSAVFYYEIGDKKAAIDKLNDVFVSIKNVDPIKVKRKALSFAELEQTVQNLMTKTGFILSKDVKEELAFIFSRGTAPIYATELNDLLDLLTEARYLDVISRKDSPLYRLVQNEWESRRASLADKGSIEDLLEPKEKVTKLHSAALLLRDLDNVDRFISRDSKSNSDLANVIMPDWRDLESDLRLATSVDDILDAATEIRNMRDIVDISSRITKVVEISESTSIDSGIVDGWENLLEEIKMARSVPEMLLIVSEFDRSINEFREKRSPLTILKFEYEKLKAKANLQADYDNILKINDALRIIETAQQIEAGNPTVSRIDRIEVLLVGVSEAVPAIRADLESYTKDAYNVRAGDILKRIKSIENLVESSLISKRFLPGFTDFAESMNVRLDEIRELVINDELARADDLVGEMFSEWQLVTSAYAKDPYGSKKGYNLDELKKIEFRERIEVMNVAVKNFYNVNFEPHADEYSDLTSDAYDLIDRGNFIDAESKILEIGDFLGENLALKHDRIIFDISYDQEDANWVLSGYLNKMIDWRQNIYLTIYDKDANIQNELKFTDTRQGEFLTRWHSPTEPGMYIVSLEWENTEASQIVYVPKVVDYDYTDKDLSIVELAREFEELESFIESFGGDNYKNDRFGDLMLDIEKALEDKDAQKAKRGITTLTTAIERYLPERSKNAVIEVSYDNGKLVLAGAVKKTLVFSEDLFVDVFDQKKKQIDEIFLKDSSSGQFSETVFLPLKPGTYVAQLDYHGTLVTDFFTVD